MERYAGDRRGWAVESAFWIGLLPNMLFLGLLALLLMGTARWLYHSLGFSPPAEPLAAVSSRPAAPDSFPATVTSRVAKGVGSPFGGWIQEMAVGPGQAVTRGQLLFRMDTQHLEERLQDAIHQERQASAAAEAARQVRRLELAGIREWIAQLRRQEAEWNRLMATSQEGERSAADFRRGARHGRRVSHEPLVFPSRSRQEIARMVGSAEQEKRRIYHQHHRVIVAALQRRDQARKEAARLRKLIRGAKRYSPIRGVVTAVRLPSGTWTESHRPIVRVDDPAGYRLILLVNEKQVRHLEPGTRFVLRSGAGEAVLEEKLKGWGREVFYTWLTLRPHKPTRLSPGQEVSVQLPKADLSRGSATKDGRRGDLSTQ